MTNSSVEQFFSKNAADGYAAQYRLDHSPRIATLLARYGLVESLKGKRVVDVGGGLGFLGELLDPSTEYWVFDGARVDEAQRLCRGRWVRVDLDHTEFSNPVEPVQKPGGIALQHVFPPQFDAAFCLEVLEHCGNPHHALVEIKKLVKPMGDIYLSIPTESVWHNTPYPSLLWPPQNFATFLAQMALPIVDFYTYEPKERGWPAYQFHCKNDAWENKRLLYPKQEEKFRHCTVIEATNL